MNKFKQIRYFFYQKIFGLILFTIFVILSVSTFSYSELDPYFGYTGANDNINNLLGEFGAYYSGTLDKFIGKLQYLIPLFFLIIGTKKIIGIKTGFFFFHFLSFVVSMALLSLLINLLTNKSGQLGIKIFDILKINFSYVLENNYYYISLILFLIFLNIFLLIYGLTLNFKIVSFFF